MKDDLMTLEQVMDELTVSRSTIYRWMIDERFPRPLSLGAGSSNRWYRSEVEEWVRNRPRAAVTARS